MKPILLAVCERCGRQFYTPVGKFCDVPTCRGWVHHIDRAGKQAR